MPADNPLVDDTNLRIVQMLAQGKNYTQIGRELHLTRGGISHRMQTVRRRVGAASNVDLVAKALRGRWIT